MLAMRLLIGFALTSAALVAGPSGPLPNVTVYPTGVYPVDRQNVQAAVNQGGVVLLKAVDTAGNPLAFNFGPPIAGSGRVSLFHDVSVIGETVGGAMTTITGGSAPFVGAKALPFIDGVRSAFRGIHFKGPRIAAVYLIASKGLDFRDCKVTGVVGFPFFGHTKGQAIWLGPSGDPTRVTGTFAIEDNVIENIEATLGYGLALVTFSGQMSVRRNTIRGVATAGILLFSYAGTAVIEDNYIEPGPALYPGDDSNFGEGIEVNSPRQGGVAYVRRNQVFCVNPQAGGIILASFLDIAPGTVPLQNSVVEKNQVKMQGSLIFGGISIYDVVSNNVVGQNQILGDGVSALQVSTLSPEDSAVSNVFNGNNISGFHSTVADVFMDTNTVDNILKGNSGSVIDLGTGNQITGFTKANGGGLQQIKEAQAGLRATLRSRAAYEKNANPFEP